MLGLWAGATLFFSPPSFFPLSSARPPSFSPCTSAPLPALQTPASSQSRCRPHPAPCHRPAAPGQLAEPRAPCGRNGWRARCGAAGDASSGRAREAAWAPSSATSSRSGAASPARRRACSAPWSQVLQRSGGRNPVSRLAGAGRRPGRAGPGREDAAGRDGGRG